MAVTLTEQDTKVLSQSVFEKLASRNPDLVKEAEDAVNEFTRRKMREQGFLRHILPPLPLTNDELDRQVHTAKPIKVVDMEPDSPAAISVPLGSTPEQYQILGNRYAVMFDRILTPKFTADVDDLRTWHMDIRQVLSDNAIKDMLAEEDGKFLRAVDNALVGAGVSLPFSGTVQYKQMNSPITRDSLWDSLKVMPETPFNLEVETLLINNITIKDVAKLNRIEMGGDVAMDVMKKGTSVLDGLLDKRWIVTIKKNLVPTDHMYQFANPKFMGKFYTLEDVTMYLRREAFMLEFFAYSYSGLTIGHTGSVAHIHFNH